MNHLKAKISKEKVLTFLFSVLVHCIIFLVLIIVKLQPPSAEKKSYTILNYIQIEPEKEGTNQKTEQLNIAKKPIVQKKEELSEKIKSPEKEEPIIDTVSQNKRVTIPAAGLADTSKESRLKFAASLLDSFLLRHPEYGEFILKQQAKALVENKNIKQFSRLELEKKINDELDDYLKKYYPEGSEHAINQYTGPGLQIPIDGIIESIKKIFE